MEGLNKSVENFVEVKSGTSRLELPSDSGEKKSVALPSDTDMQRPVSEQADQSAGKNADVDKGGNSDTVEPANDTSEGEVRQGGSYSDVFKPGEGTTHEVHHMPANDATTLPFNDGPTIRMEKDDHRQTASCGNSTEAREYRATQAELVNDGKFREAVQMDIDDIRDKFGDKYDDAIAEMEAYIDKLEQEGKI